MSISGSCSDCLKTVHFWLVGFNSHTKRSGSYQLFVHPHYEAVAIGFSDKTTVPDSLKRSYDQAVETFESSIYGASAVQSRRTLEGILKNILGKKAEKRDRLLDLIKKAEEGADIPTPLKTLAHGIRKGGNLGAHFDEDNEPTRELAKAMLDLLGYMINYIHILPSEIERLEKYLESTPAQERSPGNSTSNDTMNRPT